MSRDGRFVSPRELSAGDLLFLGEIMELPNTIVALLPGARRRS